MNPSSLLAQEGSLHFVQDIEAVFHSTFYQTYNTCLIGGAKEPLYQPAMKSTESDTLFYREDYFSSALHEIAHWCIAGEKRRQQADFGYWYTPEGRSSDEQKRFECVEVKPQALEWFFSVAAGYRFRLSLDNFSEPEHQPNTFAQAVQESALDWCEGGIPPRGYDFIQALQRFYHTRDVLDKRHFVQLPD